jgi:MerR family transcriptional regulator/heat shock protein HspR
MTTTAGESTPGGSSSGAAFRAVAEDAPVFVISVAAELAGMHAQTLRQYDRLGLVSPGRTAGGGRRYSPRDVALLREVQRLSQEDGVNLAGIKRIIELESRVEALQARVHELLEELEVAETRRIAAEAAVSAAYRRDLVPQRRTSNALVVWRPRTDR